MTNRESILKVLNSVKDEARDKYRVRILGLFGSYAKGMQKKRGSDVDVLVDIDKGADLFSFIGLSLFLERKIKRKVDIVPMSDIRKEIRESILRGAIYI